MHSENENEAEAVVDEDVFVVPIDEAIDLGLDLLLEAQYENGSWPQWYPLRGGYHDYATFNDGAINDCVEVLYWAVLIQDRPELVEAIQRAGDFFVASQLPGRQPGWAQQYDAEGRPAAARAFDLLVEHIPQGPPAMRRRGDLIGQFARE